MRGTPSAPKAGSSSERRRREGSRPSASHTFWYEKGAWVSRLRSQRSADCRAPLPHSARAHQAADGIDQHGGAQRALAGDALVRPVVEVLAVRRPCRSALVSHGPHRTAGSKFRAALRMWVRTGGARATGGGAWLISTRSGSPEPPTPTVPLPKRGRATGTDAYGPSGRGLQLRSEARILKLTGGPIP